MAATGTPTPNIGLRVPIGTDPASVDDINYNSNLLDTKLGPVGSDSVQDQIDALNSNISTMVAGTFTPNTQYVGEYNVRVVKIGRIAIAEGYVHPIANITNGAMIGILSFKNQTGMNHIFTACDTDANKAYSLYIENNSGILKSNSYTAIPIKGNGQYVTFATAYFTD